METIVVDCSGCKARLKIKAPPGRALTEIKCPKCGVKNAVSKGGVPAAESKAPVPPGEIAKSGSIPAAATVAVPPPVVAEAPAVVPPSVPAASEGVKTPAAPVPSVAAVDQGLVAVKCDACPWQTKVMQAFIGKKIRCKQCSAIILVGTGNVSPAPPPVTPMSVPPSPPIMPPVSVTPVVPSPAPVTEPPPVVEFSEPKTIALPTPVSATQALRLELENAKSKVKATEDRAVVAEQRAQVAEKALHELAAKQAGELNAANHKVATLEKELDDFRSFAGEVANDDEREIAMAEKRITSLKERLTRFTV